MEDDQVLKHEFVIAYAEGWNRIATLGKADIISSAAYYIDKSIYHQLRNFDK